MICAITCSVTKPEAGLLRIQRRAACMLPSHQTITPSSPTQLGLHRLMFVHKMQLEGISELLEKQNKVTENLDVCSDHRMCSMLKPAAQYSLFLVHRFKYWCLSYHRVD